MSMPEKTAEGPKLQSVLSLFLLVDAVRKSFDLDIEEAMLYLAVGYLNAERIQQLGSRGYIAATNVSSVADFLRMPKETARRKIARLTENGLFTNGGGIVVTDIERWFRFIEQSSAREKAG
jgi:hypothetical protein